MTSIHNRNKDTVQALRDALYNIDVEQLPQQLADVFAPDCEIHFTNPFEDLTGPRELFEVVYEPLIHALPDLERRDYIFMAGEDNGHNWVGCGGTYMGLFENAWLDIPPTNRMVAMRYHEFFRLEDDKIVEVQALWDIPQVMMQANAWPMTPSLGVEWVIPAPATNDGIITTPWDEAKAKESVQLVNDMVGGLMRFAEGSYEGMALEQYWHEKMNWYGPAGIGSARQMTGFRKRHQIPFLTAMPDRTALMDTAALFGDESYTGFTAWPGLTVTIMNDGWLGIPPVNKPLTMRSLDFWRHENGLLRENWVLVDLLHVYDQLGVDVFNRMRELTGD